MECLSYNETTRDWRVHAGLDLAAETGTPVTAAADGEVYTVYEDDQMGTTVVLRHDGGYTTHYASLAEGVPVKAGDKVVLGQTIGFVGNTALMESALGDHVCFRVTWDGEIVDPAEFLN
jgi:murein DD-endopeptidase MepM/ murein hydrolase activator NlpD